MAKNNHALKINSERGFQFDMKKKKVYFIKTWRDFSLDLKIYLPEPN